MAHKIVGIDLGSYSVKLGVVDVGFRTLTIQHVLERRVPPGDEPLETRAMRAAQELIAEHGLQQSVFALGVPGDVVSMRVLDFGFANVKRTDLERAVGAELEGELPQDLEDLIYDFEPLPLAELRRSLTENESTASPDSGPLHSAAGTRVLAAAATVERARRLLALRGPGQVEPRHLLIAGTVYSFGLSRLSPFKGTDLKREPVLVVDLGHKRTNLTVVWGERTVFSRTISRGGHHLTQAISEAWRMDYEAAERAKHADGFIASSTEPAASAAWSKISDVLRTAMGPIVSNVRQTLSATLASTGVTPVHVLLCGGSSRLRGLASYLTDELALAVTTVPPEDAAEIAGALDSAHQAGPDVALLAHGLAMEAASSRPRFDLRKGSLAPKTDLSLLRDKAPTLAAAALVLLAFTAVNAYAALYKLEREEIILTERLGKETKQLFGKEVSASGVQETLAPKKLKSPFPKKTAYDQLLEISAVLSPKDNFSVDLLEIEIKPQKVALKGVASNASAIELIEKALVGITCFEEAKRGKVSGPDGKKDFTMNINTTCM